MNARCRDISLKDIWNTWTHESPCIKLCIFYYNANRSFGEFLVHCVLLVGGELLPVLIVGNAKFMKSFEKVTSVMRLAYKKKTSNLFHQKYKAMVYYYCCCCCEYIWTSTLPSLVPLPVLNMTATSRGDVSIWRRMWWLKTVSHMWASFLFFQMLNQRVYTLWMISCEKLWCQSRSKGMSVFISVWFLFYCFIC